MMAYTAAQDERINNVRKGNGKYTLDKKAYCFAIDAILPPGSMPLFAISLPKFIIGVPSTNSITNTSLTAKIVHIITNFFLQSCCLVKYTTKKSNPQGTDYCDLWSRHQHDCPSSTYKHWVNTYLVTMSLITRGMETGGFLLLDVREFLILSIELASRKKSNSYPIF